MESTDSREPSYYEVALTNRQVLVAFVVLLTCLLAAFLSGVWVGRGGSIVATASRVQAPAAAPAPAEPLEQLTFFSGDTAGSRAARPGAKPAPAQTPERAPSPPPVTAEDAATETMRRTLEAEMAAHREPEAAPPAEPPAEPAAEPAAAPSAAAPLEPGTRTRQSPSPATGEAPVPAAPARVAPPATPAPSPTARPAATPAPALDGFWIQVYASTNGARAEEITGQLRRAGFPVVHAQIDKDGATQHRVRVGPFATRAKAEPAAVRLRSEQRLDTWITDTP